MFLQSEKTLIYRIGTEELKFYSQPIYGAEWDNNDDCVEILFTVLSIDNIISVWEAMLLERKIFFLSKSKTILNRICLALTTLIYPFKWNHVFIPVLPLKCIGCADAFVPLIMGICFNIKLNELPEDAFVVDLDNNKIVKNNEVIPKLNEKFNKKFDRYKYKYNNPVDLLKIQYCDEVFNYCDTTEGKEKFNTLEIRNIFFDFFVSLLDNFEKYIKINLDNTEEIEMEPVTFNRQQFLRDNSSSNVKALYYIFNKISFLMIFLGKFIFI